MAEIGKAEAEATDGLAGASGLCHNRPVEEILVAISVTETDAGILRETLDAKLVELRREISHTDSPRFRDTLYQVEGALQRLLAQLPGGVVTRT